MDTKIHSQILSAYISRFSIVELTDILVNEARAWNATMNGNTREQVECAKLTRASLEKAIDNLLPGDRASIEGVIKNALI